MSFNSYLDPSVTIFKQTTTPPLKQGVSTGITFTVRINNLAATGTGNDITAVTGTNKNFDVRLRYSNNDMATGLNTLSTLSDIIPSISLADVQQKIDASGGFIDIPGTVMLQVPVTECNQIRYLCAITKPGTGAGYVDANGNNNAACQSVISQRTCEPGKRGNPFVRPS